jgi:hypothetical protein
MGRAAAWNTSKKHVEKIAQAHNVRLHVCYSRPEKTDALGRDFSMAAATIEVFKNVLLNNYDYFLCTGPMMSGITGAWPIGACRRRRSTLRPGPATEGEDAGSHAEPDRV